MEPGKEWIRVIQVKRVYPFAWAQFGSVVLDTLALPFLEAFI
jgi:hypothetical protein